MSFAQEMKDFLSAYTAVSKSGSDSAYQRAVAEYYRNGGRNGSKSGLYGYGAPKSAPKTQNILGDLLGDNEVKTDPELSAIEEGAKNIAEARERALRAGDMGVVKKLDADAADLLGMSRPKTSAKPKAALPEAAPETMTTTPPAGSFKPAPPDAPKPINQINLDESESLTLDPERVDEAAIPDMPYTYAFDGGMIDDEDVLDDASEQPGQPESNYVPDDTVDDTADDTVDDAVGTKMSEIAAPGVSAGLRAIQANVTSNAALPEADPKKVSGVNALANNEGAATHEEVAAIDQMIDPESKLPARAKSAARIAAIWDTLGEKDPDKAAQLAQGLLLYDKKNSQTRGMMAEEALRQGDTPTAAKYVADAYNNDLPGDARIIPAVADDGSISAKVIKGGEVVEEGKVPPEQFAGMVKKVANGSAYIEALVPLAAQHDARKTAKTSAADIKAAKGRVDSGVLNEVLLARRAYARAIDNSDGSDKAKANIAAQKEALDAAEEKAIGYAMKTENPAVILKQLGIGAVPSAVGASKGTTPAKGTGSGTSSRTPNQTAGERSALADEAQIAGINKRLYNADSLEQAGISVDNTGRALPVEMSPSGYRSEAAAVEKARRSINPIRKALEDQLADTTYNQAGDNKSLEKKPYGERVQPIEEALNGYLMEKSPDADKPIAMSPADRRSVLRMADRVMLKNDVDPRQVIEFIDGATNDLTQPVKVDRRTGMVTYGGNKLFVDGDTLMAIAQKRGETVKLAAADRNKKLVGEAQAINDQNTKMAQLKAERDKSPALVEKSAKQNIDIVKRQGPTFEEGAGDAEELKMSADGVRRRIRALEMASDPVNYPYTAERNRKEANRLRKLLTATP